MNNYSIGERITDFFAVKKSNILPARNGSNYLDLKLSDGQNELSAKQWDYYNGPLPRENTVIKVTAMVNSYRDQIQLVIQKWEEAQPGDYIPGMFLPVCPRSKDDLLIYFYGFVDRVNDDYYKAILQQFMASDMFDSFVVAPGAKSIHHAYITGLLEHSVDVTNKALCIADNRTNTDLLITGALLHDIGKIQEYDWSGCVITKTAQGYLIGHISLGLMMLDRLDTGGDPEKFMLLCHMIASHHGKLEYGSPVEPQTKEAVILHTADMLDYQYNVIDRAVEGVAGGEWTGKVAGLNREFYVGKVKDKPEAEISDDCPF